MYNYNKINSRLIIVKQDNNECFVETNKKKMNRKRNKIVFILIINE